MLRTSSSTDSSFSAAQILVEYDGVDAGGGGGKLVEKSSKSRRIVKKPEKPQRPEKSKGHRFGGTFTEAPILRQLDTKNSSFR